MRKLKGFGAGFDRAALVAVMLAPADALAQGATAAPFEKVTVQGEAAKRMLTKSEINADTAKAIVEACVEFAKGRNQSVSVFVLSPAGDIVHSHRMDGQLPIGIETALLKAKTALYARSSSGAVAQRFNNVEGRVIRLSLGQDSGLAYYFVPGGLPIVHNDQLIGAIGVGGANMDEECAHQALTKVLGPQPPLPPPPSTQKPPQQ